jgi:hypothetical protein
MSTSPVGPFRQTPVNAQKITDILTKTLEKKCKVVFLGSGNETQKRALVWLACQQLWGQAACTAAFEECDGDDDGGDDDDDDDGDDDDGDDEDAQTDGPALKKAKTEKANNETNAAAFLCHALSQINRLTAEQTTKIQEREDDDEDEEDGDMRALVRIWLFTAFFIFTKSVFGEEEGEHDEYGDDEYPFRVLHSEDFFSTWDNANDQINSFIEGKTNARETVLRIRKECADEFMDIDDVA